MTLFSCLHKLFEMDLILTFGSFYSLCRLAMFCPHQYINSIYKTSLFTLSCVRVLVGTKCTTGTLSSAHGLQNLSI